MMAMQVCLTFLTIFIVAIYSPGFAKVMGFNIRDYLWLLLTWGVSLWASIIGLIASTIWWIWT